MVTATHVGFLALAFVAGVLARSVWEAVARWRRARRFKTEWDAAPAGVYATFNDGHGRTFTGLMKAETDDLREYLARHHATTEERPRPEPRLPNPGRES